MRSVIVFAAGFVFLLAGFFFMAKASNLNHLGPITFNFSQNGAEPSDSTNNDLKMAVASGFNSYIADKLTLAGEIMMGIGAASWIWSAFLRMEMEKRQE